MDFSNALPLLGGIWLVVEFVKVGYKDARKKDLPAWATLLVAVIAGQIVAPVLASTPWGAENIVGNVPIDTLDGGALAVVGFVGSGIIALGHWVGSSVITNIGENQPPDPP